MPQIIINGETYDKVIAVNTSGTDISGGGGGGGGDASAANQVTGNNTLTAISGKLTVGVTSAENSTSANLGISATFTGSAWIDTLNYSQIAVGINTSHASATDGLQIQQSADASTVSSTDLYTIPAATPKIFNIIPNLRYVRVVYTNGTTATTSLSLQTNLRVYAQPGSVQRPQDGRTNDNDFLENLCYLMGFNGTTFDRLRSSIANGLAVDVTRILPGATATSLGKAEDAVAASGDTGVFVLGVRRDALTVSASNTGDYGEIATNQFGAVLEQTYEKSAATYSCTVNVAAAAAATDIAVLTGSATKTVYLTKVILSGIQTTAGLNEVLLVKRSTADTGGTSTGGVAIPHDSADTAATGTVLAYTANPTTGTAVGTMRRNYQPIGGVTSVVNPVVTYEFGDKGRPLTLRGIAQQLAINLNGATLTGGTFDVTFEWFEI